jgi:hypothetical protein
MPFSLKKLALTACARAVAHADAVGLALRLADADAHWLRQPERLAHAYADRLWEPRVRLALALAHGLWQLGLGHAVAHRLRQQPAPVWQPGAQLGAGLRRPQHGPRACILTAVVCGRLAS